MWNKKRFLLLYLVILSSLSSFQLKLLDPFYMNADRLICKGKSPKSSQLGSNFTINVIKPELFFFEGRLGINISSTVTGQIHCALTERSGERYFKNINQSIVLIGNNQSQLIIMRAIPLITTFPGEYYFTLNITGLFDYEINFDMFLGMGYTLLIIILAFIAIIVIIALINHRSSNKGKKPETISPTQTHISVQSVVAGKISCPNCKKIIDEGLAFCPECGERIPEFLRYNPK